MAAFARRLHRRSLLRVAIHAGAGAVVGSWLQACQGGPFGATSKHTEDKSMQDRWLVVDGHIDIAFNALQAQRDPSQSVEETRRREAGSEIVKHSGTCTVGLPELIRGRVGVVCGTLFVAPYDPRMPAEWPAYKTADEAYQYGMAQLDYYHQWAARDKRVKVVGTRKDLEEVIGKWGVGIGADGAIHTLPATNTQPDPVVGIVPLMEGADPNPRTEGTGALDGTWAAHRGGCPGRPRAMPVGRGCRANSPTWAASC